MRFSVDPRKEARNRSKHGLDFSFAEAVFADPMHAVVFDRFDRFEGDEERWHCIGAATGSFRALLVVHCYPDPDDPDMIRIIGLRQATARERRRYEDDC